MNLNSEVRAQFLRERQRWDKTILAECRTPEGNLITVKTTADEDEILDGLTYNFFGRWVVHAQYGRQFLAKSFVKVEPHDEHGILAYLLRAPHIGAITAKKLWDRFKGEAVRLLRQEPEEVAKVIALPRFKARHAIEAGAFFQREKHVEDATIALMSVLAGKGFPRETPKRALEKWGNRAAQIIKKNPYVLMRFPGCGFIRPDELYLENGGNPARLKRQALCVWHAMASDSSGNTWFDTAFVERVLSEKIGSATPDPIRACRLALRAKRISVHRQGGKTWLTDTKRHEAESRLVGFVAQLLGEDSAWPEIDDLEISEHQRIELGEALKRPIGIFGGSPGTGKTYTAARLIAKLREIHGEHQVAVVAPTGKAAVRISETLENYGLLIKACTIHSFLKVTKSDEEGYGFTHDEHDPVSQRFIVCDEASMVDCSLLASLLAAMRDGGHLLLVGDVQQLPPVAHGAPLRDLLLAGIPAGDLREIRRNSGSIVETCAHIRDDDPFEYARTLSIDATGHILLCDTYRPEESLHQILATVRVIRENRRHDPVWDTQIIVAVNEKSPLSRKEINAVLQAELNPLNRNQGKFWVNDKIVCLKNSWLPAMMDESEENEEWETSSARSKFTGADIYVANGEQGRVLEVFANRLILEFFAPKRIVLLPFGETDPKVDLAYAISAHKSQGSEWPVVIVALDDYPGASMVCDRSWLYTAISRAKKICMLVGKEETARAMCRRQKIMQRKTFVVERLRSLGLDTVKEVADADPGGTEDTTDTTDINGAVTGSI